MTKPETVLLAEARKDIQYMQGEFKELKEAVKSLPDELILKLDERYAKKHELEEIKETVAPFTEFRRKMWGWIVKALLITAIVIVVLWEVSKFKAQ